MDSLILQNILLKEVTICTCKYRYIKKTVAASLIYQNHSCVFDLLIFIIIEIRRIIAVHQTWCRSVFLLHGSGKTV